MNQRGGRRRGSLDLDHPVDLIRELTAGWLRRSGRRIGTGVLLIAALVVMSVAFVAPFLIAYVLIAVFGLAVEPYKWIGSSLIIAAFVAGGVAAPLAIVRVVRRSRRVIALTDFADEEGDDPVETGLSPIVAPGVAREQWAAEIRALDERLTPPPDPEAPLTPPAAPGTGEK